MKSLNRRTFLRRSSMGLGAAAIGLSQLDFVPVVHGLMPAAKGPIGFQSFPIREVLVKDFPGTLKAMAAKGYRLIEMCSPSGYVSSGFGPLASMKAADIKKTIEDAGLTCPSCHFTFTEFKEKLDDVIAWSKELGLSQMVLSSFWLGDKATLKDYLDSCDILNACAAKIKAAGMATGYHNHEMEFKMLEGQLIYDAMMGRLDGSLVKMQFQTEVINLGYKAATYFNKYPGRFISAHLSDWTADKKEVPLGQGVIDWKEFFDAAPTGGLRNFFVEMAMDTFAPSAKFLRGLA